MRNKDCYLSVLGGGQQIGASSYALQLGDHCILLDCGQGLKNGLTYQPNLQYLLQEGIVDSFNQIEQIFISHAHLDHVGSLLPLMAEAQNPVVYMTELTACLTEHQLYDQRYLNQNVYDEKKGAASKSLLESGRIIRVNYFKEYNFGDYKVSFYPAGHIPGAMMVLFEYRNRRILYTGDYSLMQTGLTNGCEFPKDMQVDTLIMCGLHAKHPWYRRNSRKQEESIMKLFWRAACGNTAACHVSQLSKGIELLQLMNSLNKRSIPIYIDESILNVVRKMESMNISILGKFNYVLKDKKPAHPHIFLSADIKRCESMYKNIEKIDFTLHEDFEEMHQFIRKINPKYTYLVHCAAERELDDLTIEQRIMLDPDCRTQIIFAENETTYKL